MPEVGSVIIHNMNYERPNLRHIMLGGAWGWAGVSWQNVGYRTDRTKYVPLFHRQVRNTSGPI